MFALGWIAGTPLAATMTLGLFLMMTGLISSTDLNLVASKRASDLTIIAKKKLTEPEPAVIPKPEFKTPPETIIDHTQPGDLPDFVGGLPTPDIGVTDPIEIKGPVGAPIVRVAPAYPESCRSRSAQGTVLIQFDVAADGSVINPVILQSDDRCFDRTVIRAVTDWKYPPAYLNGQPMPRYGVVATFSFLLADE